MQGKRESQQKETPKTTSSKELMTTESKRRSVLGRETRSIGGRSVLRSAERSEERSSTKSKQASSTIRKSDIARSETERILREKFEIKSSSEGLVSSRNGIPVPEEFAEVGAVITPGGTEEDIFLPPPAEIVKEEKAFAPRTSRSRLMTPRVKSKDEDKLPTLTQPSESERSKINVLSLIQKELSSIDKDILEGSITDIEKEIEEFGLTPINDDDDDNTEIEIFDDYKVVLIRDPEEFGAGQYMELYHTGAIKATCDLEEGELHGDYYEWYANTQLKYECAFIYGDVNGELVKYYPGGDLEYIAHYKRGIREGPFRKYYPEGELKIECNFKNNQIVGERISYMPDGTITSIFNYVNGIQKGEGYIIYENKEAIAETSDLEVLLGSGALVAEKYEDGELVETIGDMEDENLDDVNNVSYKNIYISDRETLEETETRSQ